MSFQSEPPEEGVEASIARAMAATGLSREEVIAARAEAGRAEPEASEPLGASVVVATETLTIGGATVTRAIVQQTGSLARRELWLVTNGTGGFNMSVVPLVSP